MTRSVASFRERYGPWAVVAGASEGLGAAFARGLAARGCDLVLLARRADALEETAAELRDELGVRVEPRVCDLADSSFADTLVRVCADREVGVGVYNAAYAPIGAFLERPLEDLLRVVDVNVRGPVVLTRTLAPSMAARGAGALVLMSSLAGLQGSPRIAAYAASKAFNIVLGEGLWEELRHAGIDVIASCAGAVRTPGYLQSAAAGAARGRSEPPGTLDAEIVVERTLSALGRSPRVVPGFVNQIAEYLVGRVLPRKTAIAVMSASTKDLE